MGITGVATKTIPKIVEPLPGGGKMIDSIEYIVSWARANSLWPLVYGTACCAMEMMSTGSSRHDWARFGVEVARATPRQADLIVLAGTIVEKMGKRLVTLYEQMPGPKYVIAMGACAISGGPFYYDSYSVIKGGDRLVPVDVYIPGCPPRPEALLYGIMKLQEKIRTEGRRNPWTIGTLNQTPVVDAYSEEKKRWHQIVKKDETADSHSQTTTRARVGKPQRKAVEKHPVITPKLTQPSGLANKQVMEIICQEFPSAELFSQALCDDSSREDGKENASDSVELLLKEIENAETLDFKVSVQDYLSFVQFVKTHPSLQMDMLMQVTAVDWQSHFYVIVHLLSTTSGQKIFARCKLSKDNPEIASLSGIHSGAEWHEREVYDMFGITFTNHPDLRRMFLEDDFYGYPLSKDFEDPERVIRRPY